LNFFCCYSTWFLHRFKTKNGDDGHIRWKPIYYIPLERARRGEHKETKNSQNCRAVWEKTKGEVFDPKIKSSNLSHNWSNWHFKWLHGHKRLFESLVEFQKFQIGETQTHKSGPKPSCSNFILEHSIDWINILDQFFGLIRC
jgi:hypothetical protein